MLLVSPLVLFVLGVGVARLAKSRRVWRRHSLFTVKTGAVLLVSYTALSLALLFDAPSVRALAALVGSANGTAFFVGFGLWPNAATWPLAPTLAAVVILSFMLYPFWLWSGIQAGFWAFGRSPKQTGILGLLR